MTRTKDAKNFTLSNLCKTAANLKKRSQGKRPRWSLLLLDTGYTLERLGRMTSRSKSLFLERRGFSRRGWSVWEYASLVHALRNCADVIEARARAQEKESYDEAIELLKE